MSEKTCPRCGKPLKLIPAGVSKRTGKPYKSFYSCTRECGATAPDMEQLPTIDANTGKEQPSPRVTSNIIIMDRLDGIEKAIQNIDERIDGIGKWIATNVKQ